MYRVSRMGGACPGQEMKWELLLLLLVLLVLLVVAVLLLLLRRWPLRKQ